MKLYGNHEVVGSKVFMQATDPKHYKVEVPREGDDAVTKSFGQLLGGALSRVNNLQLDSDKLTQQMVVAPETVSIHSVMIAAQKAELALSMTKAISDRVIQAYQSLSNLR